MDGCETPHAESGGWSQGKPQREMPVSQKKEFQISNRNFYLKKLKKKVNQTQRKKKGEK